MSVWPISFQDVIAAEKRIRPFLPPTPLRDYAPLNAIIGHQIQVFVKHENHHPTNSFKVRNGLSVMTTLSEDEKGRGVVAATRGNHGLGLAWAGKLLKVPVTICVPLGNNPEKNEAVQGLGAELIEHGGDYDEAAAMAERLVRERGMRLVHSTNNQLIIAGAGTMTLEVLQQHTHLDALVVAIGGGSQAVGALTVARELRPGLEVYGVQAERASAIYDSWHTGQSVTKPLADTFADGLATRQTYQMTFGALREGLAGFVTVSETELAAAVRQIIRTTHNLAEGAGAAGLAGLMKLRDKLAGKTVGIVLSGSNIDAATLRRILTGEL